MSSRRLWVAGFLGVRLRFCRGAEGGLIVDTRQLAKGREGGGESIDASVVRAGPGCAYAWGCWS